jgi:hypothetical protein
MKILEDCFMGVLSCDKYKHRRENQKMNGNFFEYKYFIGNPKNDEIITQDDTVILPCGDNYEDLPIKTKLMLEWVLKNRPKIKYIFKTDDDIIFNFGKLYENYEEIKLKNIDYSGNVVKTSGYISTYHIGKCSSEIYNKTFFVDPSSYCSGGGYFLSRKSAEILIKTKISENTIFEDHFVGKSLNNVGIFPEHINLHNNSCFW